MGTLKKLLGMDCQSLSKRQRIDTDDKTVSQYLADHLSVYVKNIEHSLSLHLKSQPSGRERILEERLLKEGQRSREELLKKDVKIYELEEELSRFRKLLELNAVKLAELEKDNEILSLHLKGLQQNELQLKTEEVRGNLENSNYKVNNVVENIENQELKRETELLMKQKEFILEKEELVGNLTKEVDTLKIELQDQRNEALLMETKYKEQIRTVAKYCEDYRILKTQSKNWLRLSQKKEIKLVEKLKEYKTHHKNC